MNLNEVSYSVTDLLDLNSGAGAIRVYKTDLRDRLQNKIANSWQMRAENILLTQGADGAIELFFKSFKQKNFFLPAPSYRGFHGIADIHRIPYKVYCPQSLRKILINASVDDAVFICRPDNPTGAVVDGIERMIFETEATVLVDEAYIECCPEKSFSPLLEMKDNFFVVRSFSKTYAMPGIRLGYIMSSPGNISKLQKQSLEYPVSNLATYAAIEILEKKNIIERYLADLKADCLVLQNELKQLGYDVPRSETYFFSVDLHSKVNAIRLFEYLKDRSIFVADFTEHGLLRVTASSKDKNSRFLLTMESFREAQVAGLHA
jgi:histidinol-phosphate/aromatic aminotransferase/cobyric acid decarboxylase-like protein